jgi:hypothetical protein
MGRLNVSMISACRRNADIHAFLKSIISIDDGQIHAGSFKIYEPCSADFEHNRDKKINIRKRIRGKFYASLHMAKLPQQTRKRTFMLFSVRNFAHSILDFASQPPKQNILDDSASNSVLTKSGLNILFSAV